MAQALVPNRQKRVAPAAALARESSARGGASTGQRRHELDWLRSLAVLGLIPFHAAIIFTTGSRDYVKSEQTSALMDLLASFITFWGIPLIFLIGGAAARFALDARSPRAYVTARLTRLGIPLIVGVLAIVPIQVYVGTLSRPGPALSYPEFYVRYLGQWVNILHGSFPTTNADWIGHLWFIPPLLLFCLLALPFSRLLRTPAGAYLFERMASAARGWRTLVAFGLPLALSEYLLRAGVARPLSLGFQLSDIWPGFVVYLIFFLYGYILYADARLVGDVRRYGAAALALAVLSWVALQVVIRTHHAPAYDYSAAYALYMLLRSYVSWFWVMAILGLGMRYLNRSGRLLDYLNQATYPIYVVHMPVLTIVAYYVVRWQVNFLAEFVVIVAITLVVTTLLYDLLIRRIGALRFLFGLSAAAAPARPPTVGPSGGASHGREAVPSARAPGGRVSASMAMELKGRAQMDRQVDTQMQRDVSGDADQPDRNLALLFRERSARYAESVRWREKVDGVWRSATGAENRSLVNEVISGLDALGAVRGDRIGILSETRWEWTVTDWAILGLGGVTVTLYANQVPEMLATMIADSGARFVFAENARQLDKLASVRARMPELRKVILFDAPPGGTVDDWTLTLDELRRLSPRTASEADDFAAARAGVIQPDDMASIVYTSGTTGEPKGVVLTHANLLAQVAGARTMLWTIHEGMVDVLFLPLAHVLGREEHLLTLDRGAETTITRTLDHLADDIRQASPHILLAAPRVYEKAYAAVQAQVASSNAVERTLFRLAVAAGKRALRYKQDESQPPVYVRLATALGDRLVFRRIRAAFGGRLEFAVSGSAPLDREILNFFHIAGVHLLEGWGLTETGGAISVNRLENCRLGTVGQIYPGHDVRVADDGELLVRGPCVFREYFHKPEATAEAIDAEGWFHTGDLGTVDSDGFVTILDRKKELIATAGGKKIAPQRVENVLKSIPLVSQAVVFGDRKPYIVALLTLDEATARRWADERSIALRMDRDIGSDPRLIAYLGERVAAVNKQLARFETVKRFAVVPGDFTVANGLLTPTQKVRRRQIAAAYHAEIERLYQPAYVAAPAAARGERIGV